MVHRSHPKSRSVSKTEGAPKTKSIPKSAAKILAEEIGDLTERRGIRSRPLFGVLPIKRVIPQDLHSLADYSNGVRVLAGGLFTRDLGARMASLGLGYSALLVTTLSDDRLSPFKLIPIEAHEVIDHLWGAAAIAAPFVLGYARRAPVTAAAHIITGMTTIAMSLFTDYRAARGAGHMRPPERIGTAVQP